MSEDWEYHRNGVSGCGFYVCADGERVAVRWVGCDEDGEERVLSERSVPVPVLEPLTSEALPVLGTVDRLGLREAGLALRATAADGQLGLAAFDFTWDEESEGQRMVLLWDATADPADKRVAAFALRPLLEGDVRFMHNSWRGDVLAGQLSPLVPALRGDATRTSAPRPAERRTDERRVLVAGTACRSIRTTQATHARRKE